VNDTEAVQESEEPPVTAQTPVEKELKLGPWVALGEPDKDSLKARKFLQFWNEELRLRFNGPPVKRLSMAMRKLILRRLKENPRLADDLADAKVNNWFKESNTCNRLPWILGTRNLEKVLVGYYEPERLDDGVPSKPATVHETTPELEASFERLSGIRIGGVDEPGYESVSPGGEDPLRGLVEDT
jgi:hypothetical protein